MGFMTIGEWRRWEQKWSGVSGVNEVSWGVTNESGGFANSPCPFSPRAGQSKKRTVETSSSFRH